MDVATTTDYYYDSKRLSSTQQTDEGYRGFRKKRPSIIVVEAGPTPGPNFKVRGFRRSGARVVSKKTPTFANRFLRDRMNIDIRGRGGELLRRPMNVADGRLLRKHRY